MTPIGENSDVDRRSRSNRRRCRSRHDDPADRGFSLDAGHDPRRRLPRLGYDFGDDPLLGASVDYAGLEDAYAEGEEPEFDGTVIERTLSDGRAEVTVLLHSRGVNAWVVEIDPERFDDEDDPCGFRCQFTTNPTVFGYRPGEVPEGMEPALADTFLRVVFINNAPGDPPSEPASAPHLSRSSALRLCRGRSGGKVPAL